jgi:hypothetical protein
MGTLVEMMDKWPGPGAASWARARLMCELGAPGDGVIGLVRHTPITGTI